MTLRSIVAVFLSIAAHAQSATPPPAVIPSGQYLFKTDAGFYLQIAVEQRRNKGPVLAVKGTFSSLDPTFYMSPERYLIKKGSLDGSKIDFETRATRGTSYSFTGTATRGSAATPDQDDYYEVSGTLTQKFAVKARTPEVTETTMTSLRIGHGDDEPSGRYFYNSHGPYVDIRVDRLLVETQPQPWLVGGALTFAGRTTSYYSGLWFGQESKHPAITEVTIPDEVYRFVEGWLDGDRLSFKTYEGKNGRYAFSGTLVRSKNRTRYSTGYFEIRGTLTHSRTTKGTTSVHSEAVTLKLENVCNQPIDTR